MKMRFFIVLAAVLTGSLLLSSCDPYEDGPPISFKKKEERVANTWKYELALENDRDVTERYKNVTVKMTFAGGLTITTVDDTSGLEFAQQGYWYFMNDQEDILFYYSDPAVWPDRDTFHILRLKEKEMWLRWTGGDSIVMESRLVPQ